MKASKLLIIIPIIFNILRAEGQTDLPEKLPSLQNYASINEYIKKNTRYPEEAKIKNIHGTVIITAIVDTSGYLYQIHITKMLDNGCDAEALRVIRAMPRLNPAMKNGKPVKVYLQFPIVFGSDPKRGDSIFNKTVSQKMDTLSTKDSVYNYDQADEKPEFPGGPDSLSHFIARNFMYQNIELECHGKVYISLIIMNDGSINDVKIKKDLCGFGNEAVRIVKLMPRWTPGKIKGKPVNCRFVLPVKFVLPH
jgi:TonB family protein